MTSPTNMSSTSGTSSSTSSSPSDNTLSESIISGMDWNGRHLMIIAMPLMPTEAEAEPEAGEIPFGILRISLAMLEIMRVFHRFIENPAFLNSENSEQEQLDKSSMGPKFAINETQKNIIDGTLTFVFDEIRAINPPSTALKVLELISKESEITKEEQDFLENLNVFSEVDFVRKIFKHPYPQNRAHGDCTTGAGPEGIINGQVYSWRNGHGTGTISEPEGLLSLRSRDDINTEVTKEATVNYIKSLIDKEKAVLKEKDREEKFGILVKRIQKYTENLTFLNFRSQILGTDDNPEARLVRSAFTPYFIVSKEALQSLYEKCQNPKSYENSADSID